jgi:hypothetical protein
VATLKFKQLIQFELNSKKQNTTPIRKRVMPYKKGSKEHSHELQNHALASGLFIIYNFYFKG